MAKGLRASSKKANRTKLRAKVFGPVEQARAERLHAKMLETIAQPKPERSEMDTAEDANTADDATKDDDDDLPKGSSFLTAPIPPALCDPSTKALDPAQDCDLTNLCLHLGLCSDILGFTSNGHLKFAFDPLPLQWSDMDVDGAAAVAVAKSSTKNKDKSQTRKQLRRKSSNKISFPASKGKGALKPFHGQRAGPGRIGKRRL
ncbi:glycosylphosphatidylinositol anchor synthesis protein [Stemphylium lycopersici]|uniref:Glycosylphosphatidylinositol anchor synthesis protein n=1 Tax=Stemphylium lycopersici TaxID=183478 RepID=A0A364N3C4_STELY|nr:glycosylphosphatidylinositol anchor synthesis protein [Stemphylium lycopersici]RAR06640.1 glycosylphosphatidylinositol anchor synthesis protein [Stemphylium lycopersici]RAR11021.1 glycosylphosphatidylinositol anchor synthesis protein [Stemphylium lycopersici]